MPEGGELINQVSYMYFTNCSNWARSLTFINFQLTWSLSQQITMPCYMGPTQLKSPSAMCIHISLLKELSLCHKLKFSNSYTFATWLRNHLRVKNYIMRSYKIHSFKYDIGLQRYLVCGKFSIPLLNLR